MPLVYTNLRIFLASPSDVAADRAKLETVIDNLKPLASHLGLIVEPMDWHNCMPRAGRPQQVIFNQIDPSTWDVFIGILWHRFGTPPAASDPTTQKEYLSGTEEEFRTAYDLHLKTDRPEIMMYRCKRDYPTDMDPEQLIMVRNFFKEIENPKGKSPVLVRDYDSTESFEKMMLDHLQKMLLDYGERAKKPVSPEVASALTPVIPNNLPRRQSFFGRAKEMAEIMRALSPADRTWGVLLDGIGGIGKTALAIEAAHRAQEAGLFDAFVFVSAKTDRLDPDGIKLLQTSANTLADFLNETARTLGQSGITRMTTQEKRRALLDELKAHKTLLIYDNLETLSKEDQEAIADFLRDLPTNCKAIITSRRRGGEGAIWLRVETLDLDAALNIIENEIKRDTTLRNKLLSVRSRWHQLYDETNGSPLALVHTLGLMRVRASLDFDSALALLRGSGQDDNLTRFIYYEASKELTDNDKTALAALSFFSPTASFESWFAVTGLSRVALQTAIDRLSALSLLDNPAGEERFGLHPLTRNFVRQSLLADPQKAFVQGMQFAQYWQKYAKQFGGSTTITYKTYGKLEAEWPNLDATVSWLWEVAAVIDGSMQNKEAGEMLNDMAKSLSFGFLMDSGRWDEVLKLSARAYEIDRLNINFQEIGNRVLELAWIYYELSNYDQVDKWLSLFEEILSNIKSSFAYGMFLRLKGLVAKERKNNEEAERSLLEALEVFRTKKEEAQVSVILRDLGRLESDREDFPMAEKYFKEALKISEKENYKAGMMHCMLSLGILSSKLKRNEEMDYYQKALILAEEIGRQGAISAIKYNMALVYEKENKIADALSFAMQSLNIRQRIKHPHLPSSQALVTRLQSAIAALDNPLS